MKPTTKILIGVAIAVSALQALAQGLFSGLANRQDDLKNAQPEFEKVFTAYDPSVLVKGELARKDDGTPDIAIDGDGNVLVGVKLKVDLDLYAKWLQSATNTFAKFSEKVLASDKNSMPKTETSRQSA